MNTITVTLGKPATKQMVSESSGQTPQQVAQNITISVLMNLMKQHKTSFGLLHQEILKYVNTLKTKKEIGRFFDSFDDADTPLSEFMYDTIQDLIEEIMEPAEGKDASDPTVRKAIADYIQAVSKTKPSDVLIQYFVDMDY